MAQNNEFFKKTRREVILHYGGKCICCGDTTLEFLELDHINNDGAKHRKEMHGHNVPLWCKQNKYPKSVQVLCANCHRAKTSYGVCPHKSKEAL